MLSHFRTRPDEVRSHTCPTCGARPGQACVEPEPFSGGKLRYRPTNHIERVTAYNKGKKRAVPTRS